MEGGFNFRSDQRMQRAEEAAKNARRREEAASTAEAQFQDRQCRAVEAESAAAARVRDAEHAEEEVGGFLEASTVTLI